MRNYKNKRRRLEHYLDRKDIGTISKIISAARTELLSLSLYEKFRFLYRIPVRGNKDVSQLIERVNSIMDSLSPAARSLIAVESQRFDIYFRARFLRMVMNKELVFSKEDKEVA